MNCRDIAAENVVERFLAGELTEPERDGFEAHYFECDDCFALLEATRLVRPVLAEMPAPGSAGVAARPRRLAWVWLAAAAAFACVIAGYWPRGSSGSEPAVANVPAPPAVALLRLSEIRPAPYSSAVLRGSETERSAGFEGAIRLYQSGNWRDASAALLAVAAGHPERPAALHFAGVSLLLDGNPAAALDALDQVIALGASSVFEEEARFYRAQALMLLGRGPEARAELERVIGWRGDYEVQAQALLRRL